MHFIKDPNFEPKKLKKKTNKLKNVRISRFFQILTYNNFRPINAINMNNMNFFMQAWKFLSEIVMHC